MTRSDGALRDYYHADQRGSVEAERKRNRGARFYGGIAMIGVGAAVALWPGADELVDVDVRRDRVAASVKVGW